MSQRQAQLTRLLALALLLGVLMIAPVAARQSCVGETAKEEASANSRTVDGLAGDEVVTRMIERNRLRNEHLQSYSAVRKYEIRNPDGRVSAEAIVHVDYRAPGKKTFQRSRRRILGGATFGI
jgi:hypothetical protein